MIGGQCNRSSHSHWRAKPLTGKRRREREEKKDKTASRNKITLCRYTLDECPDKDCHFHPEDNEEESDDQQTLSEYLEESKCDQNNDEFKHQCVTAPTKGCDKAKASTSFLQKVLATPVSIEPSVVFHNVSSVIQPPTPTPLTPEIPKTTMIIKETAYNAETEMVNLYLGSPIGKKKGLLRIPRLSEFLPDLFFRTTTVVNAHRGEEMAVSEFHNKTWAWREGKSEVDGHQHMQQLLTDSYESVTVVEVFTQLAKLLYEDKHLCSRVAVGKDGSVHKDFLYAIRHIATAEEKYNFFREQNYDIYENTLRYTFNRYILRGLTDSLLIPVGGVAKRPDFRHTGRFRRTPRIGQCFE